MQHEASPTTQSRRRLPRGADAGLDAHPVGSWLLRMGFDLWIRAFYRRTVIMPAQFCLRPGTLIASNHQRDVDGPMLGTLLARRRGLHFQSLPFFATREDLFRPGILARLTVRWPAPLRALLGRIPLAWFFPLGRAEPMRRVREFTLGETLHALQAAGCGERACATLLNARGRREIALTDDRLSLSMLIARCDSKALERCRGLRRLRLAAIEEIAPAFRTTINAQLAHFAQRLDRGRCVYFAPEGGLSADGHFCRIRAGCFRLARATTVPPWIQPMALGYDTLAPGRSRVVVRIGARFRADTMLDRRAFDAGLRSAILNLAPVTPSHLLARYLLHGPASFTRAELTAWLQRSYDALDAHGVSLDTLWSRTPLRRLVARRLRWLARTGLLARDSAGFRNTCPRNAEPGWQHPGNIAHYLDHALADIVADVERVLPC